MPERIHVEVTYAEPGRQILRRVELAAGATVADAIAAAGIAGECAIDVATLGVGIWSKPVARSHCPRDGDRIELYRPLKADPKDARRRRAERAPLKR